MQKGLEFILQSLNYIGSIRFYVDSLKEFHRVLKPGGILIFKCQDKISSGTQYMSHVFIHEQAVNVGFYPKDLFILLAKSRLMAE